MSEPGHVESGDHDDAAGASLVPAPSTSVVAADLTLPAVVERATIVGAGATRLVGRALGSVARRVTGAPEPADADEVPAEGLGVVRVAALGLALDAGQVMVDTANRATSLARGFAAGLGIDDRVRDLRPPTRGPVAAWYRRGAQEWSGAPERASAVLRGSAQDAVDVAVGGIDLGEVVARTDLVTVVEAVDLEPLLTAMLDRVAIEEVVDQLLGSIDLDRMVDGLLDQVDLNALMAKILGQVDMAQLTESMGIGEIVSSSTRTMASTSMEFVRHQGVSADDRVDAVVARVLRRRRAAAGAAEIESAPGSGTDGDPT